MSDLRPVVEAENRLERFNADRDRIVSEVQRRLLERLVAISESGGEGLEYVLNEVAYSELKRLGSRKDRSGQRQALRWRELANHLGAMGESEKRAKLNELVGHYARDVVGNFNPRVYRFANGLLPAALGLIFTRSSGWRQGMAELGRLSGRIQVEGHVEQVRNLCDRGTIVVTPTHSSNMDSIALGFGLSRSRLPPMTYGAGKNLFSNPLISYFMHNLGAYRVDRRLRFKLYKDVLKEYSTVLLESGYHSLFFPGGTRNRSNQVDSKLKLGLLGTAVTAYSRNVAAGAPRRRIYVVPVTINYRVVLEAETLIDDYLAETGKSRYIISDDEFSRVGRILEFLRKTLALEGAVVLRFGRPRDPFGNLVNDVGDSLDRRGRIVDPASYVLGADGQPLEDSQRDAEYTCVLGREIARDYRRETVFQATSVACRAIFDAVSAQSGTRDIYRLLRVTTADTRVPTAEVLAGIDRLRDRINAEPELGRLQESVRDADAGLVLDWALSSIAGYHTHAAAEFSGDQLRVGDMKLVYYYQNRTQHIGPLVTTQGADASLGALDSNSGSNGAEVRP